MRVECGIARCDWADARVMQPVSGNQSGRVPRLDCLLYTVELVNKNAPRWTPRHILIHKLFLFTLSRNILILCHTYKRTYSVGPALETWGECEKKNSLSW